MNPNGFDRAPGASLPQGPPEDRYQPLDVRRFRGLQWSERFQRPGASHDDSMIDLRWLGQRNACQFFELGDSSQVFRTRSIFVQPVFVNRSYHWAIDNAAIAWCTSTSLDGKEIWILHPVMFCFLGASIEQVILHCILVLCKFVTHFVFLFLFPWPVKAPILRAKFS